MSNPRLLLIDDPLFLRHVPDEGHPERPERLSAVRQGIESSALARDVEPVAARDATHEELAKVHGAAYLDSLRGLAGRSGMLDPDTYFGPSSYAVALRAAGACLAALERLQQGGADYAFCASRPPGHHAGPSRAMGFCLINNVAVAAAHLLDRGCERVAIVDWDVHHGNGTEEMFYERADVLYVSLHQAPHYPGSGGVRDVGAGKGEGFTVNVPLRSGSGDREYLGAFAGIIVPILKAFAPNFLLVSAGYDAHLRDPLAGMRLTGSGYAMMTRCLMDALPAAGRGRMAFVLEGGYDLRGLSDGVQGTLDALAGVRPFDAGPQALGVSLPAPLQEVAAVQRRYWPV